MPMNMSITDSSIKNISSIEAWSILKENENAYLIDVRTIPEWSFIGVPDLKSIGKSVIRISWRIYPAMEVNNSFYESLSTEVKVTDTLLFLCRSGGRSLDAAFFMYKKGYKDCMNILDGFEGEIDRDRRRGNINGWKAANLPWEQT